MSEQVPSELRYTSDHEWIRVEGEVAVVGITDFAQDQLGDVVYVDLPAAGTDLEQGQAFGEVESTKSVSDLLAPVAGVVEERNEALDDQPELINSSPYGEGWLIKINVADPSQIEGLLDADGYQGQLP